MKGERQKVEGTKGQGVGGWAAKHCGNLLPHSQNRRLVGNAWEERRAEG